jgi:site-specific DNA recombinase
MRTVRATRELTDLKDLRVGLYCRVSQDEDGSGKSTGDQEHVGREWVERVGASLVDCYVEVGSRSASRFATKEREQFSRLLADIRAGRLEAVWFWELSRSQRRLDVFASLRDLCRDQGVLWVIRDRVYDPSAYADMMTLGMLSVIGENESEMTSLRVQRGKASTARAGGRSGRIPYGYRAIYDRETGQYLRDELDFTHSEGQSADDSPAAVVREIYDRIKAGHSINSIRRDLNDRGVRTRAGYTWGNTKIRILAMSPTYLGQRVYRARQNGHGNDPIKAVLPGVTAKWPPMVDAETWWAVHRILTDPNRSRTRPGRARHLLSGIALCNECGTKLGMQRKRKYPHVRDYVCPDGHVAIGADVLDEYVESVLLRWLSDPGVMGVLTSVDDSAAAAQARADVEQLRAELDELYRDVEAGRVSPVIATKVEGGLQSRIAEAEQRIEAATLPPVLRGNLGAAARSGWEALDVVVRRQIIRTVAEIRVRQVGRGRRNVPLKVRIGWRWLIGADDLATQDDAAEEIRALNAASDADIAARRAKAAHLRAEGCSREMIAAELGVTVHVVKKDLVRAYADMMTKEMAQ